MVQILTGEPFDEPPLKVQRWILERCLEEYPDAVKISFAEWADYIYVQAWGSDGRLLGYVAQV